MKGLKKVLALLLATAMFSSLFAGCGKKDSESETKDDDKEVSSETDSEKDSEKDSETEEEGTPEKLTVWVPDNIRIEDWNTNAMTIYMEEQLGYDLEIIPLSSEGYTEKVNVSLTTGSIEELPDVIIGFFSDTQVWSWAQAESIISLTDYYNDSELNVNIQEAIARTGVDYTKQIVSPDGNLYGFATYNQSYGNEFPSKIWIYQPWLEALGAEIPTTTGEFYDLLKQVAATDLNGNGKKDEIGLIGAGLSTMYPYYFEWLMNAFVYSGDAQYRVVEDGEVSVAYTTEEWKEGLRYIKKLFDEGLILQESLTMTDDQFKTMMNTEDVCVFSLVYASVDMVDASTGVAGNYVCIDTITGPDGVNYSSYVPSVATTSMVITANCEYPKAAFRLGDLMSSELIGISQRWGEEGFDWDYPENADEEFLSTVTANVAGSDLYIAVYSDATFWAGTDLTNGSWRQTGPFVRQYAIANGMSVKTAGDLLKSRTSEAWTLYQTADHEPDEVIPKLIYTTEEADLIADIEATLVTYVQENMGAFIKGTKDLDKDWDAYVAEFENIGLSTYLETVQTVYDRMYK